MALGTAQALHAQGVSEYGDPLSPVCRVRTHERVVALTFDDGPDPVYTPLVLRLLQSAHARATFFLIGERAVAHSALVRQELRAGAQIGDHTWSHPSLSEVSVVAARSQIERTLAALEKAGIRSVHLFRAPYGDITPAQLAMVKELELIAVHWTLALDHYVGGLGLEPIAAARQLAADVRPGAIILAHDAKDGGVDRGPAVQALALLLPLLRARGYDFVTVDELLTAGTPVRAVPRLWFWQTGFNCPSG
jgi:peptidoglycan/xylan/chitin deacetylase (PgdA/CDA1 family)